MLRYIWALLSQFAMLIAVPLCYWSYSRAVRNKRVPISPVAYPVIVMGIALVLAFFIESTDRMPISVGPFVSVCLGVASLMAYAFPMDGNMDWCSAVYTEYVRSHRGILGLILVLIYILFILMTFNEMLDYITLYGWVK